MAFWYNVVTGQVESDDNRSMADDVLGPYETQDEASRALEIAATKTKQWDQDDAEWNEGGASSSGDSW
ncbi:methionine aminopeptidase [Nostocoides sp.]|jgi:hypothetical protein|uniref:methionine aminopeptidase n=1 Tax=Nostocoides sp. TaxID=1917966 RepID=UPI002CEEE20C|nr:methionine aminopeptidase [Tetrasphaera sp.]